MANISERREVFYFTPETGWAQLDSEEAKYRLTAVAKTSIHPQIENHLFFKTPQGWKKIAKAQEVDLSGYERGLIFRLKPKEGNNQIFLEISSQRFIDAEILRSIFENIPLYDAETLELLDYPERAINKMCIPSSYSDMFYERVNTRKGKFLQAQPNLEELYAEVVEISKLFQKTKEILYNSANLLKSNNQDSLQLISKNAKDIDFAFRQSKNKLNKIRSEKLTIEYSKNPEFIKYGDKYLQTAENYILNLEKVYNQHLGLEEKLITFYQNKVLETLSPAENYSTNQRALMVQIVEYLTDLGIQCRLTESGMSIDIDDYVVNLDNAPSILNKTDNQAQLEN